MPQNQKLEESQPILVVIFITAFRLGKNDNLPNCIWPRINRTDRANDGRLNLMIDSRSDWTKHAMQAAGFSVAALAIAVLIGWNVRFVPLIQVLPNLAPMQRMTAVGFLLSGFALIFAAGERKRATVTSGLMVFTLALLVCLEYALGADLGIDQLLGRDYINVKTSNPGRMSPVTALCFLGTSLALISGASQRLARYGARIAGMLASTLMAVGTVSLLGYLLGHTRDLWVVTLQPHGTAHFGRFCHAWRGAYFLGLAAGTI